MPQEFGTQCYGTLGTLVVVCECACKTADNGRVLGLFLENARDHGCFVELEGMFVFVASVC